MSGDSTKLGGRDGADVSGDRANPASRDPADVSAADLSGGDAGQGGGGIVRVARGYGATPELVYDAWVDPGTASRFLFATPTGEMVRAEIDARVGGSFVLVERREGEDVEHVGEYLELVRPSDANAHRGRIAFRFAVPKYSPLYTDVTVELAPDGAGCAVKLSHAGVPPEWAAQTEQGWRGILDALAPVVAAPMR